MTVSFRPGTIGDLAATYDVFVPATADIEARAGTPESENSWRDPKFVAGYWARRQSLFAHLTRTAEQYWVAEAGERIIGYARTTIRDGARELVEFFVHPDFQGRGVGRELLARAFPLEGARWRVVLGTTDIRALTRYLKARVYPRFPVYYAERKPERVRIETDLVISAATTDTGTIAQLAQVDRAVIGFARDVDHEFLSHDRQVHLFHRGGNIVGYGYFGPSAGPIAVLEASDLPAAIAWGESMAAEQRFDEFGMHVPLINRAAVTFLLERGYRLDPFTVLFYSDEPFGSFDRYIMSSPDYFI